MSFKNRFYKIHREFLDKNDYQEYAEMTLGELIQEERNALNQIRDTSNSHTLRYLENDLHTIRRVLRDLHYDQLFNKITKL